MDALAHARTLIDAAHAADPARAADGRAPFGAGAQLTVDERTPHPCGYLTSSVYSPACGEWVGLALVARELARDGVQLIARDPLRGQSTVLKVTSPVHYDPDGKRMKS